MSSNTSLKFKTKLSKTVFKCVKSDYGKEQTNSSLKTCLLIMLEEIPNTQCIKLVSSLAQKLQ